MKKSIFMAAIITIASLLLISDSFAQFSGKGRGRNQGCIKNLNLTDAQQQKINDLRLTHQEEMIKLRSELDLKQLEVRKLFNNNDISRSKYLSAVDELSAVRNKLAQVRANHKMDIYEMLDNDQKKEFMNCPGFERGERRGFGDGEKGFRNNFRMRRG
jgi:Spy/CpxP family protein refolding chaperone